MVLNQCDGGALILKPAFPPDAADNQTKDAALLRATEAIFAPQATGYIAAEGEAQVPSTMIEA